jgi:cobalt-precorrin 5A hydrolase / precorrin-3B C17-methyltransferase
MIGLVWATEAGRRAAQRVTAAWPGECTLHDGPIAEQLRHAWHSSEAIVAFLATGATVRLIAPLLAGKHTDPAVVCVDETGRFAVALVGGHTGANSLAERIADVLGAQPVITTGSDSAGVPGLDTLGFTVANPQRLAPIARAVLDGEPVHWRADETWPLPALPDNVGDHPEARHAVIVSDRLTAEDGDAEPLILRPPSLVVGIGASRGVSETEIRHLVDTALADAGLSRDSVRAIATADLKADEQGLLAYAEQRGWPMRTFAAHDLATVDVPNPSEVVRAAVGTPSVAEAAALLAAHEHGHAQLVVPKTASAMATVAVARLTPRGRLAIIGLGPGAEDLRTPRATRQLRAASIVVGLDQYVDQIRHVLRPGTRIIASGLGAEEGRARTAAELARAGHAVALIGSGDAGIYAMASPALEFATADIDVVAVPGVTAALAASSLLGAPLGHDHAYISLSDLHTPWEVIQLRLHAAAAADLVVCLYNPRSARRTHQLPTALRILREHRPAETPVGLVRDASRPGEHSMITTLAAVDPAMVDMNTVVVIGATSTRTIAGRMVTPRGYAWMPRP